MSDLTDLPRPMYDDITELTGETTMFVDTTPDETVEDFDLGAFIDGMRPTRRSVKLYMRSDLAATIDQLSHALAVCEDDAELEQLRHRILTAQETFLGSGRWFTVQKKSSEWVRTFRARLAKDYNLKLGKGEKEGDPDDELTASLHQLAAQVVIPTGVTPEALRTMLDTNEAELAKLLRCMVYVNNVVAEAVVTRDFSRPSSAGQTTTGS